MRVVELHLDRYGPFTERRLVFEADRDLVVVHGRNEAGKTSALAGLTDALFGIEARSRFGFLHGYGDMRIGARIAASDGRALAFRRRKGNKATLLDEAEQPLADEALAPYLGRVDRGLFAEAFGLTQRQLREGGERLAAGGGSLGEALLAASPGLGRLIELRRAFAADADQVFTERRSGSKLFYVALDAWNEARRRLAETTLSAETLKRAGTALDEAAEAVAALQAEQRDLRATLGRLQRLARAIPRLAALDRLSAERAGHVDRPAVDEAFAARAGAAAAARTRAVAEHALHTRDREATAAALSALHRPEALLAEAAAVDRLAAGRSAREAAGRGRAEAEGIVASAGPALDAAARRLGFPDAGALPAERPTAAAAARVRALAAQRTALDARFADLADRREQAAAARRHRLAERENAPGLKDPRAARASLADLSALPALQRTLDEREAAAAAARVRADDARARLAALGASDPVALRHLDRTAVEQAAAALDAAVRRVEEGGRRAAEAAARAAEAERRGTELEAAGDVPSDAAVAAARADRDARWDAVRELLFADVPAPAGMRLAAARSFERAIEAADGIADRRAGEAERVAALAEARAAAARARAEAAAVGADLDRAETALAATRAAFAARLADAGLDPAEPRAVLARIDGAVAHAGLADTATAAEAAARASATELARLDAALTLAAADLGVERVPGEPWIRLLSRFRAAVETAEAAWEAARDRERDIAELAARESELAAAAELLKTERDRWGETWAAAVEAIGLPARALPQEADAALAVWTEIAALDSRLREAYERNARLAADCDAFDGEASRLAAAFDLPAGLSAIDVAARLGEALREARLAADRHGQLSRRIEALDEALAADAAAIATAEAEEAALRAEAGVGADADLDAVIAAARALADLGRRLDDARAALLDEAGGFDETALRDAVAGTDPDRLAAEIAGAEDRLARIDAELAAAIERRTTAAVEHAAVAAREGAETAGQAAENAVTHLAELADEWRILQAANRLAGAVVEEYRRRHQNPVLGEAGRLFAEITAGRYPALAADYGEEGEPRLVAIRDDGRRLDAEALSEGTRDQLFLALRLATLVDHARRAEPLPFVADDLFVTFDETRTAAGLAVLADVGRSFQTILFTHHAHVAGIAQESLGPRVQILRL